MTYDVFLSGPITGVGDYRVKFAQAVCHVHACRPGAIIWNPAQLPEGRSYGWYMRQCVEALFESSAVYLLPGWESSAGAVAEAALARSLGIPCETWERFS